jgi:hypothetical protein
VGQVKLNQLTGRTPSADLHSSSNLPNNPRERLRHERSGPYFALLFVVLLAGTSNAREKMLASGKPAVPNRSLVASEDLVVSTQ